jgi:hypothetical protein
MEEQKPKEVRLEIQLDETIAQGSYVNLSVVNHNENEFTLDFIYVQPQAPRAKVRSRIITSPRHAKQMMLALQDNINRYEQLFGEILPVVSRQEPPVGDYH